MIPIIQIVPRLFPEVDGVGDYALSLAHQMDQDFNIKTHFIVGDPSWSGSKEIDGFNISQITKHSSTTLVSLLNEIGNNASSILLQYVGCGYAKRGCPLWLVKGLEDYKNAYPAKKLVTMFHETYGSGAPYYGADPPWISAFWLSPVQKNIASRLVLLSNHCVTSREQFRQQLHHLTRRQKSQLSVMPVFSNVEEVQDLYPLKDRHPILVVFGSCNSRARVYEQFPHALRDACRMLEIEKIYDIGSPIEIDISKFSNIPVISMGVMTASEIGKILLNSKAGILNYPPEFLAKSGVYAAYSAYGLIPIVVSPKAVRIDGMDGLRNGENYWAINHTTESLNLEVGKRIANQAYAWYKAHNLATQAEIFAKQL
jgi:hypothetical protein